MEHRRYWAARTRTDACGALVVEAILRCSSVARHAQQRHNAVAQRHLEHRVVGGVLWRLRWHALVRAGGGPIDAAQLTTLAQRSLNVRNQRVPAALRLFVPAVAVSVLREHYPRICNRLQADGQRLAPVARCRKLLEAARVLLL